jgi:hypothetical protein
MLVLVCRQSFNVKIKFIHIIPFLVNPTLQLAARYQGGFVGKVAAPLPLLAFILGASSQVFRRNPIRLSHIIMIF